MPKKFSTDGSRGVMVFFMSENTIRIIEHEGQTYNVAYIDLSTSDKVVIARKLIRCKYSTRTGNVTSATWSRNTVRLVNPTRKIETVKFTSFIARKLMIKLASRPRLSLGTVDATTARTVAKALGSQSAFELRCFAVGRDLGIDYQTSSKEDRQTIEALAREEG
jgi:hypothetical protein